MNNIWKNQLDHFFVISKIGFRIIREKWQDKKILETILLEQFKKKQQFFIFLFNVNKFLLIFNLVKMRKKKKQDRRHTQQAAKNHRMELSY